MVVLDGSKFVRRFREFRKINVCYLLILFVGMEMNFYVFIRRNFFGFFISIIVYFSIRFIMISWGFSNLVLSVIGKVCMFF